MALIEIDGLPFLKMGDDFPWRTVTNNQRVLLVHHLPSGIIELDDGKNLTGKPYI